MAPPAKPSQTLLSHLDACSYAGYLYLKHKGHSSWPLARGTVFHDFAERATRRILDRAGTVDDETLDRAQAMADEEANPEAALRDFLAQAGVGAVRLDHDEARDLMQQVIRERVELNVPAHEQDALRAMAWNFASGHVIDPPHVVGVEAMLELEVGDWTVRGKLDRLEVANAEAYIHDFKTSRSVPSEEEFEGKFQPQFYAMLAAYGRFAEPDADHPQTGIPEARLGERVAEGLRCVHAIEHYPRFTYDETGELVNRRATYSHPRLTDFRETVAATLARLEHGLETNEWQATPSSHCGICPMEAECPIEPEVRGEVPAPATEADARALGEDVILLERRVGAIKRRLRAYCDDHGELVVGDYEYGLTKRESRRVRDHESLRLALERGGASPADHVAVTTTTRFDKRRIRKAT